MDVTISRPFGGLAQSPERLSNRHLFAGYQIDPVEELYLLSWRWYDPNLSHFVQPDSMVPDPANPVTLNRYLYANGNPLTFRDPTGHGIFSNCPLCSTQSGNSQPYPSATNSSAPDSPPDGQNVCDPTLIACGYQGLYVRTVCLPLVGCMEIVVPGIAAADDSGGDPERKGDDRDLAKGDNAGLDPPSKVVGNSEPKGPQVQPVTFGHGARHLEGTDLSASKVEVSITTQIQGQLANASKGGNFYGRVTVDGKQIEYRAYLLDSGTYNVGTYYLVP